MNSEEMLIDTRNKVAEMLMKADEGIKVHLKKEDLDKLIFDTVVIDANENIFYKIPVWTGSFLSKLDLSELDFENVSWCMNRKPDLYEKELLKETIKEIEKGKDSSEGIDVLEDIRDKFSEKNIKDFSNTNAVIDFLKSFEAKYIHSIAIYNTNLSNVNLSNNTFEIDYLHIYNSDLSNTKINIGNVKKFFILSANLENVDLSDITVTLDEDDSDLELGIGYNKNERSFDSIIFFRSCNLCNTGLNIIVDKDSEDAYKNHYYSAIEEVSGGIEIDNNKNIWFGQPEHNSEKSEYAQYSTCIEYMENFENLEGCKLNGMRIWPKNQINSDEIINSIQEQINKEK